MPRSWMYFFALVFPILFRVLLLNLSLHEWFWYNDYKTVYQLLARLSVSELFLNLVAGWGYPVFVITIMSYWLMGAEDETVSQQFLLLPLAYVPFAMVADILINMEVNVKIFYTYPFVIIPFGYIYVFFWIVVIWLLGKIRIVNSH